MEKKKKVFAEKFASCYWRSQLSLVEIRCKEANSAAAHLRLRPPLPLGRLFSDHLHDSKIRFEQEDCGLSETDICGISFSL